ncbi:MAG: PqqD family protein [Nautiliaceae bacterium]
MLINQMIIDENGVAFIPSLGISFQINETAGEIIELFKQGKNKEEIVQILAEKYERDWREVYIDVEDFFIKLKVYGLIQ